MTSPFRLIARNANHIVLTVELVTLISVLASAANYFLTAEDRKKEKQYAAWQVVNSAQGKGGSGGRIQALSDLHRDGVSLAGVDVSGSFLSDFKLAHADLFGAVLDSAYLVNGDFQGSNCDLASFERARIQRVVFDDASLRQTKFSGAEVLATFRECNLSGCRFDGSLLASFFYRVEMANADFTNAQIQGTRFEVCGLTGASFRAARLFWVSLRDCDLSESDFRGALLYECDLSGSDLSRADLRGAVIYSPHPEVTAPWSMGLANVHGVRVYPPETCRDVLDVLGAVAMADTASWERLCGEALLNDLRRARSSPFEIGQAGPSPWDWDRGMEHWTVRIPITVESFAGHLVQCPD
jgi:uncharacterized protein YjbI with pentapeptide repeats